MSRKQMRNTGRGWGGRGKGGKTGRGRWEKFDGWYKLLKLFAFLVLCYLTLQRHNHVCAPQASSSSVHRSQCTITRFLRPRGALTSC